MQGFHLIKRFIFILVAGFSLTSCQTTTNPTTGKSEFTPFMSSAQEAKIGAQEHPKILAQFGGVYDDPEIGAYIASIGGRIVANSELRQMPFTFTVLDSPIVNAFALPGGYVYVTRGLVALANSEAELAGVLAHEVGHVTARHSAKRYSRSVMAGIGGLLLGAVLGSSEITELAQQGSQIYLAGFSREQEYEADLLGVRYLTRTGYDPFAEADFLTTLKRHSDLESRMAGQRGAQSGSFLSTHPGTGERVRRAIAAAEGNGAEPYSRPRHRERFMAQVDGLLYGDNQDDGFARGQDYYHPGLRFAFRMMDGYRIVNTDNAVIGQGPNDSFVVLDRAVIPVGDTMAEYLAEAASDDKNLGAIRNIQIGSLEGATATSKSNLDGKTFDLLYIVLRLRGQEVYRFRILTPPAVSASLSDEISSMAHSLRILSEREAQAIKPQSVRVVAVGEGQSLQDLAARMPFSDYKVERFLVLNGIDNSGRSLRAGTQIKLISDG